MHKKPASEFSHYSKKSKRVLIFRAGLHKTLACSKLNKEAELYCWEVLIFWDNPFHPSELIFTEVERACRFILATWNCNRYQPSALRSLIFHWIRMKISRDLYTMKTWTHKNAVEKRIESMKRNILTLLDSWLPNVLCVTDSQTMTDWMTE